MACNSPISLGIACVSLNKPQCTFCMYIFMSLCAYAFIILLFVYIQIYIYTYIHTYIHTYRGRPPQLSTFLGGLEGKGRFRLQVPTCSLYA